MLSGKSCGDNDKKKPPWIAPAGSRLGAKDYAGLLLDGMAGTLSPRVLRRGDLSATSSRN
jgi:hypothetical protein